MIKRNNAKGTFNPRPWSYSRYTTAMVCLQRFYLRYVRKLPGMPTEAILEGSRLHGIFADLINEGHIKPVRLSELERKAWERVEPLTRNATAEVKYIVNEQGQPEIDESEVFMLGILDVVSSDDMFIDWKMGQSMMYDPLQSDWYAVLYKAWENQISSFTGSFIFPFVDIERKEAQVATKTYEPEDIPELFKSIKERIINVEDEIALLNQNNQGDWEPNLNACNLCLVWSHCPYYNRGLLWKEKISA